MQKDSPNRRIEPAVNNIFRLLHHQMRFQIYGGIDFFQVGRLSPGSRRPACAKASAGRHENAVHHVNLRPRNQPLHLSEFCFQFLKIFSDNSGNYHRGDISKFFLDSSIAQNSSVSFSNSDKYPSSAFSNCSSSPSSSIFISTLSVPVSVMPLMPSSPFERRSSMPVFWNISFWVWYCFSSSGWGNSLNGQSLSLREAIFCSISALRAWAGLRSPVVRP